MEELKQLHKYVRVVHKDLSALLDVVISSTESDLQQSNVPRKLSALRTRQCDVITRVSRFKRNQATHTFVMMINSKLCDRKPYALPVQCIPYAGLKETTMRRLLNELIRAMINQGMRVAHT